MEYLACAPSANVGLRTPLDFKVLVFFGDRGKAQHIPFWFDVDGLAEFRLEYVADQVVLVQPLHDQNDAAGELVIEPAYKRVVVPVVAGVTARIRECLIWLERIVDDDEVGTASCEHPSDGRCLAASARCRQKICHGAF